MVLNEVSFFSANSSSTDAPCFFFFSFFHSEQPSSFQGAFPAAMCGGKGSPLRSVEPFTSLFISLWVYELSLLCVELVFFTTFVVLFFCAHMDIKTWNRTYFFLFLRSCSFASDCSSCCPSVCFRTDSWAQPQTRRGTHTRSGHKLFTSSEWIHTETLSSFFAPPATASSSFQLPACNFSAGLLAMGPGVTFRGWILSFEEHDELLVVSSTALTRLLCVKPLHFVHL